MKIKNLAFFGIMAAIMGVAGTARADTTTVIASQAYVDAKDALDEKTANKETATYAASTNKTSTTVYPSMATLKDAYDTLHTEITNVDLSSTINGLDLTDAQATGTGTVVKSVTQTDGQIAVTKGTIANGDVASDAAIADSKIAFSEPHTTVFNSGITSTKVSGYDTTKSTVDNATDANVVATSEDNTNLLKGTGLQKAVAHLKGNGATNYTAGVDNTSTANTGIKNETVSGAAKTAWDATLTAQKGDDYLTTLAAVERRVQEGVKDAVTQAGTNVSTAYANKDLSNLNATGTAVITDAVTSGAAGGTYSNTTSGLTATTIQGAIDEVEGRVGTAETNITANTTHIGTLTELSTTEQDNLVAAINEVNTAAGAAQTTANAAVVANTAITGATKTKITYDSKGLVTAGADLEESDIPELHLAKVTDVTATAAEVNILDGVTATTTELNYVDGVTSNIQTQLDAKQGTITDGRVSATNGFVKTVTQTSGSVGGTTALGVYVSDMNNALKDVNSNSTATCTKGSPCTLTYYKDGTNEYMRWTPMDTESTNADTTADSPTA